MITVRKGIFETNSSSVHVLVIPKDTDISIPSRVYLEGGEYGWQHEKVFDTINYMYQACLDAGEEEVSRFILYLMDKGIDVDYHGYDQKKFINDGFIDHGYEIPLEHLFKSKRLLDRFLFGTGSYVQLGNDNSDNCPSIDDYDSSVYDLIEKGN